MTLTVNKNRIFGLLLVLTIPIYLTACGGGAAVSTTAAKAPFGISLDESPDGQGWKDQYSGVRLDVVVPVFDPNIPADPDDYDKLGVWPELRRTEAVRFAVTMTNELQNTGVFGHVRTTPDTAVSSDLYVQGKIVESNGEDVEISVQVHDTSGKRWMKRTYKHRVKEYHWQNIRKAGVDPYQPAFKKAAEDIAKLLKKKSPEELTQLRLISDIVFVSAFSHDAFAEHIEVKNKRVNLVSLPAVDDPMLVRTRAVRVLDGMFMDRMQNNYVQFVDKTNSSYVAWQEHSMSSAKAEREAKSKATMQAIGAALLLFGAAAAADNSSSDTVTNAAIAGAAIGGVMLMQKSFASSKEGKYHRDNLMELGGSLNIDVAPSVIEVEEQEITLQGDVKSQYRLWQKYLREIYQLEDTPAVQL